MKQTYTRLDLELEESRSRYRSIIISTFVQYFQGAKVQPVNLGKVVKLLTDPHSVSIC